MILILIRFEIIKRDRSASSSFQNRKVGVIIHTLLSLGIIVNSTLNLHLPGWLARALRSSASFVTSSGMSSARINDVYDSIAF